MKNLNLRHLTFLFLATLTLAACNNDDDDVNPVSEDFTLTIENVQTGTSYLNSGTTGFLAPGESESFSFNAGRGHYLTIATMFVQSNDLFYAFSDMGMALYDESGGAVTGDITGMIDLWDAGTEVNEEPGVGENQAPRQSGPDTGGEENGTVELIDDVNDGYTYPDDESVIRVSLAHDGGTMFTATIENISAGSSLPSPLAPGIWAVHGGTVKVFERGEAAPTGLEGLAEDGANGTLADILADDSGYASPFAPGVLVVHEGGVNALFDENSPDRGQGLELLAEDGDPGTLQASLEGLDGVKQVIVFNTPEGGSGPAPLMGGQSYSIDFDAEEGDYVTFATMLIHTNDLFFAPAERGMALFSNGTALNGDVTDMIDLWDSGTEVNEYPGAGNSQPARGGGNSGVDEGGNVRLEDDEFSYPSVADLLRVTISRN